MISAPASRQTTTFCITVLAVTSVLATMSHDPVLLLAGGSVVALAVVLLWRAGEAPVLLMAAGCQLSQVIVLPLHAALMGGQLHDVAFEFGNLTLGTWFALAAMLSLVAGMWIGQLGVRRTASAMELEAAVWSPRAAFVFCLATLLLSALFVALGDLYDGLRQPFLAAARIKWAGVFVLTYVCTTRRRGFVYVLLVAFFELVRGSLGYFADFKEIFIVLLVGTLAASSKLNRRMVLSGALLAGFALTLGAFWSAIKTDYRTFLSLGSLQQQTILVPIPDRLGYLMDRAAAVDGEMMRYGFDTMARRWGYVGLLAATMRNVPAQVPFENGALVGATIMHVLQPRLLFPEKPPLRSDTEITVLYSGINLDAGGNATDTSISLGYVAELYVDFGFVGTLAAIFILGFLSGRVVKYLIASTALPAIVSSGLAVVLMMSVMSFEQGLLKVVGSAVTTFVAILALRISLLPYLLSKWGPTAAATVGGELPHGGGRMAAEGRDLGSHLRGVQAVGRDGNNL